MTDFLSQLKSRQDEISGEIAGHLRAVASLTAELTEIAAAGRVYGRFALTEKAQPPAPEGEYRPVSPSTTSASAETEPSGLNAPDLQGSDGPPREDGRAEGSELTTEAPTPLPDADERHRPAEAKTSDQEPSVSDGSAGMQDRCESIPAPSSPAMAPKSEEGRTTGKPTRAKAFVAPPGEHQERTAKRLEVADLHDREPWLSPDDAAQRLFIPVVNLRIFSQELDITWSHPRPAAVPAEGAHVEIPRTVQQKVTAMHRMHPTWTAPLIAKEIGAPLTTVSTYLSVARRIVANEARAA